ncbi:hypothetical protein OC842_006998 [Tilletia horrida]|uniref:Uncharacterized protein n=1 Tax=Tilletia horrida TaxID=155126 RepID=A0AAN6G680_9BASI|nr:hypothetical protein OC842_006998 [Tilletia horrida]
MPDAVTDPKRLKLKTLSSTLHILVSVEPWTKEDAELEDVRQKQRSKEAALLLLELHPGAGDGLFATDGRRPTRRNQVCASTAHLLTLQRVLELVLIFFGVQLKATEGIQCKHEHGVSKDYCPLILPPEQVSGVVFCRVPRSTLAESAASTNPGDPFQEVTALQMCQPLWDFVEPVVNEGCVVYVRLKARPRAQPGLPHQLLCKLAQAFGIVAKEQKSKEQGNADAADEALTENSKKRKRDDGPEGDEEAEGTHLVPSQTKSAPSRKNATRTVSVTPTKPPKPSNSQTAFRTRLLTGGPGEVCAVLGEQTIVEAAHLLPSRIDDPKIVQNAFVAVFGRQTEVPTSGQLHCLPLFVRRSLPTPKKLWSMYDDVFLGMLLSIHLHKLLDDDSALMVLRGASVLLGVPTTRTQLGCFQPACPTIRYNREDEFDWSDMHQRQLQHEEEVKPRLGRHIPETKWAALHLSAAICFFKHCMKDCDATQDLLVSVTNDPDFTDEVIAPHGPAPASDERQNKASSGAADADRTSSHGFCNGQTAQTEAEVRAESITSDPLRQYRELEAAFEEDEDDVGEALLKFQDDITAIMALCMLATCAGSTRA